MEFKIYKGLELLDTVQLAQSVIKIGRLSSSHILLDDVRVGRMHAAIEPAEAGVVRLIDLGTSEGTQVNGVPVDKNTNISVGDRITIEPYTILCQNSEAEEATPDEPVSEEPASEEPASEEPASEAPPTTEQLTEMNRLLETVIRVTPVQTKADAWDTLMAYIDSDVQTTLGLKGAIWALRYGLDKS